MTGADIEAWWKVSGMPVSVVHTDGEQVRKHRKRRINKKWLKRYGRYHTGVNDGQIIVFEDLNGTRHLIMTEETFRKVKKEIKQ